MSYNTFALFYDRLTENADYEVRSDYISNFFSKYGNGGNRLVDLACGTGTLCSHFKEKGYKTAFSKGYLFVDGLEFLKPELRKGVLTAIKD